MTARTVRMLTAATTASTWQAAANSDNTANLSADHTGSAVNLVGGLLDEVALFNRVLWLTMKGAERPYPARGPRPRS